MRNQLSSALFLALAVVTWATPRAARAGDEQELELARGRLDAGLYAEASARFARLLDLEAAPCPSTPELTSEGCRLSDPAIVQKARAYFAIALVAQDRRKEAAEQIEHVLRDNPQFTPSPAIYPQSVIELFYEVRAELAQELAEAARQHLRGHFLGAQAALTGVNFAIAETGGFVVCTNEGNADMGAHLAPVHIACMGIEKLIPKAEHLGVFLRLLARSATGQPSTVFSSHFLKPRPGRETHLVLVDNGRSRQLARADFRKSLACIRCAACFNTCPVYRRSGGHSYSWLISGPIGSILAPNVDKKAHSDMPFASTLCGSCTAVCPVKIDIHAQLLKWRQEVVAAGGSGRAKPLLMRLTAFVLRRPALYRLGGALMRLAGPLANLLRLDPWTRHRDLPPPPARTFHQSLRDKSKP